MTLPFSELSIRFAPGCKKLIRTWKRSRRNCPTRNRKQRPEGDAWTREAIVHCGSASHRLIVPGEDFARSPFRGMFFLPHRGFRGKTLRLHTHRVNCTAGHQQLAWLPIRQQLRSIPWRSQPFVRSLCRGTSPTLLAEPGRTASRSCWRPPSAATERPSTNSSNLSPREHSKSYIASREIEKMLKMRSRIPFYG